MHVEHIGMTDRPLASQGIRKAAVAAALALAAIATVLPADGGKPSKDAAATEPSKSAESGRTAEVQFNLHTKGAKVPATVVIPGLGDQKCVLRDSLIVLPRSKPWAAKL